MAPVRSSSVARVVRGLLLVAAFVVGLGVLAAPASALSGSVSFSGIDPRPAVPTGLTTTVSVPFDPAAPHASQLQRLQITLPQGFDIGPQFATADGGLRSCSAAAFAVHGATPASCAAESIVGAVQIVVPTVSATPLTGSVFLGAQTAVGQLPPLYVEATDTSAPAPRPTVKLVGTIAVDAEGRTSINFDEIPAPAFSELRLSLAGGAGAALSTPGSCGTFAGTATLISASDGSTALAAGPVAVDRDCELPPFAPNFTMWPDNPQAGAETTTTIAIDRADRSPRLGTSRLSLPDGLLANIGTIPECPLTGDDAARCGGDSQIGTVEAVLGVGPTPRTVQGRVHVIPRPSGSVAGVAIVVDARFGDVDLGPFVMPARIDLRPATAGLDVTYTIPSRFRGMALNVRSARVRLDRPGYMLNPSACGPLAYSSTLSNEYGQSVTTGAAVAYSGCGNLLFVPTLAATLAGETAPLAHPAVRVGLNMRPGDSTLKAATVTLPRGVGVDLDNVQNACPREVFDAVACSAAQRVGTATARVGVTPEPIPGDVYLVRIPGQTLPGLGLSFTGRYAQRVVSSMRVSGGRLVARFDTIPDLPLRTLDMDIFGGKAGPLKMSSDNCAPGAVWDATFSGQGGQLSSHTIAAPCAPVPAKRSAITLSSFSGLTWRISNLGGRTLQAAKLTLPSSFKFVRARARSRQYQVVKLTGASATLKVSTRSLTVSPRTKTTRSLSLKLKAGSVARTSKSASTAGLRRVKVKVRLAFTDGNVQNQVVTVRAR